MASLDSGTHQVNMDDAVFSGKVTFQGKEYVLLLLPGLLVCREFATESRGFTLKLDQITGSFQDRTKAREFHITAFIPRSAHDQTLVQGTFDLTCSHEDEVLEWVETLQSVVTDRNIRAIAEDSKKHDEANRQREEALTELRAIFPATDEEVIRAVLASKKNNLQAAIDELLKISDPNYHDTPAPTVPATSTPQDQLMIDEQLALALQDELFVDQLRRDQHFGSTMSSGEEFKVMDKIQEMSDVTKKKFQELYHKFKRATADSGEDIAGQEMMAMKGASQKKAPSPDSDNENEDDEEEADVPLEKTKPTLFSRKDGYMPVSSSEQGQMGKSSLTDDDL